MASPEQSNPETNTATCHLVWWAHQIEDVSSQGDYTIPKVPSELKKANKGAFQPQVVSIGPYNWQRRRGCLQDMEHGKALLLHQVFKRETVKCSLEDCLNLMQNLEMQVRRCYDLSQNITITSHEFVEMLLLDSLFILECFYASSRDLCLQDHPIFPPCGVSPLIQRDLLMMENQLPFYVLVKLVTLMRGEKWDGQAYCWLVGLVINFFRSLFPGLGIRELIPSIDCVPHLLGLVRLAIAPELNSRDQKLPMDIELGLPKSDLSKHVVRKPEPRILMHSVSKLQNVGALFVRKDPERKKFTKIEFQNGKLCMAPVKINEATKSIFLNLVAFEQCYRILTKFFTSYVCFMNALIKSSKDVECLKGEGIIDHNLESDQEVADLFNSIRGKVFLHPATYYLYEVSSDLTKFSELNWRNCSKILKHKYGTNPRKTISLVAIAVLMILTIAHAILKVLPYRTPLPS